jgi:hypothetical protein
VTRKLDGTTLFSLRQEEFALLNKSTTLHGTPLYAALVQDAPDACLELVRARAHLSPEEQSDPAVKAALMRISERDLEFRRAYESTR